MLVTLDEHGDVVPDARVETWVDAKLAWKGDIHTANMLVIECLRAKLHAMPKEARPVIKWVFYGKEVHFDDNVKSRDAWENPLTG